MMLLSIAAFAVTSALLIGFQMGYVQGRRGGYVAGWSDRRDGRQPHRYLGGAARYLSNASPIEIEKDSHGEDSVGR